MEWATIAFAVMVAAFIVASLLMNKAGHYGTSLLPTLTVAVGVTIVIAAYTWALTVIGTTLYDRR